MCFVMYFSYAFAFGFAFLPNQTTAVVSVAKVGAIAKKTKIALWSKECLFFSQVLQVGPFQNSKDKGCLLLARMFRQSDCQLFGSHGCHY